MRKSILPVTLLALIGLVACGTKKESEKPASDSTPKTSESTPAQSESTPAQSESTPAQSEEESEEESEEPAESEEASEELSEGSEEAPVMPEEGYGLYFSEAKFGVGVHLDEQDHGGREQYLVSGLEFVTGETFQLYDFANKAGWVIEIDPYSFGANGDESKVAEYVTKGESEYTVVKNFEADVYIKLKFQDDQIYFGLK